MRHRRFFDVQGALYPFDVRHEPADRAYFDREGDGRIRLRLLTEVAFAKAAVVVGEEGYPLELIGDGPRFRLWESILHLEGAYYFALTTDTGDGVYVGPTGVANANEGPYGLFRGGDVEALTVPEWAQGAVIYQIFPDRFSRGETTPAAAVAWGSPPHLFEFQGGTLWGIADQADHLTSLGIDAVYLNPINTSPSTHRYDATDFRTVDPALGGEEALSHLVDELHRRNIRIILDVAYDHHHPEFFAFQDLIRHGPQSRYAAWYTTYDWPLRVIVRPHLASGLHYPGYLDHLRDQCRRAGLRIEERDDDGPPVEPTYRAWYGVPTMPQVDMTNPEVVDYFLDVSEYWVAEFDIDGFRMDVARELPHEFWEQCRRRVRARKGDVLFLAEIWGDTSAWLQGREFDATMNYTFRDLCLGFFARSSLSLDRFADGLVRMAALYAWPVTLANQNLLGSHDVPRFVTEAGGDRRRMQLATLFQLTYPGAAGIYYGDEVGSGGGGEDSRDAFPWDGPWDTEQLELTRRLIELRRRHPALRRGEVRVVWRGHDALAFTRTYDGEQLLVIINRSGAGAIEVPVAADEVEVLWGEVEATGGNAVTVSGLRTWSGAVLSLTGRPADTAPAATA